MPTRELEEKSMMLVNVYTDLALRESLCRKDHVLCEISARHWVCSIFPSLLHDLISSLCTFVNFTAVRHYNISKQTHEWILSAHLHSFQLFSNSPSSWKGVQVGPCLTCFWSYSAQSITEWFLELAITFQPCHERNERWMLCETALPHLLVISSH